MSLTLYANVIDVALDWAEISSPKNVYLLHICNCFTTMGAGVAKELALRYPQVSDADNATEYGSKEKLGTFSMARLLPNLHVVNIYAQYGFGGMKRVDNLDVPYQIVYDALIAALYKLNKQIAKDSIVVYPQMGAGIAGGNWEIINTIINEMLPTQYKILVIYKA